VEKVDTRSNRAKVPHKKHVTCSPAESLERTKKMVGQHSNKEFEFSGSKKKARSKTVLKTVLDVVQITEHESEGYKSDESNNKVPVKETKRAI